MPAGPVAGRITDAPLTLLRFVAFAPVRSAAPDATGGGAPPPWIIGGDTAPDLCSAGNGGCAPGKFLGEGETTGWPIALRAVGGVIGLTPGGPPGQIPPF